MTIVLGGHLLLAPAPIAARAVATMLGPGRFRFTTRTMGARPSAVAPDSYVA
jgi:hypothetical protein